MEQDVPRFPGRVAIIQPMLATYRVPLFDDLASLCERGLSVLAGQVRPGEGVVTTDRLNVAKVVTSKDVHFLAGPLSFCWQRGLISWLEEWNPDVLIVMANPRYVATRLAIRWMHRRGRPVLGWGLGTMFLSEGLWKLRTAMRRRFLGKMDGMIAYSSRAAREYAQLGYPAEKIWTARNAATRRPTIAPPQRPDVIQGVPTVLFVGRLTSTKRIDNLLKACAAMPPGKRPRLRIVGDGPPRAELEALARQIYPTAEFLGGVHGPALRPIFTSADLFVLPGLGGLAIQEAMANGLPVIVAEADGTQEDLVRPNTGWNVAANDLDALTAALGDALDDPGRLRTMGAEAYRVISEEINIESMVQVFLQAISAVSHRPLVPTTGG